MTFRSDHGKVRNDVRRSLIVQVSDDERSRIIQAEDFSGCGVAVFVSAAMLAFESLDRESQIATVDSFESTKKHPTWNVKVPPEIHDRMSSWSFPLFTRGQVLRALCLHFITLSDAEKKEWITEVYIFVGDPRQQSPATPTNLLEKGTPQ